MENASRYKVGNIDSMRFILDVAKKNRCVVEDGFYLCNVLKYLIRYNDKNGMRDLLKAKDYLDRLISFYSDSDEGENGEK